MRKILSTIKSPWHKVQGGFGDSNRPFFLFSKQDTRPCGGAKRGFSLVEVIVSVTIFTVVAMSAYMIVSSIITDVKYLRERVAVSALANNYLEVARNLPYSQIGTMNGNPNGSLADQPNPLTTTIGGVSYQIYYVVNYIDDPADGTIVLGTDLAPNDYKQIKLYIKNMATGVTTAFLTTVVPSNLENLDSGGALSIKVFDAVGAPVPNATIHITNTSLVPDIDLTRTSDSAGNWIEVGLPDSANSYHVSVSKNGYSVDQTYASSVANPSPIKPDATILNGQVTDISFSIDKVSSLTLKTLDQTCQAISGVGVEVRGAKLIGTPDVLKFDHSYNSDNNGSIVIGNAEWDTYTPALTGSSYMIFGSSPVEQIGVFPDTSQSFTFVLGAQTANSLLVIVKDDSTDTPLEGASVTLERDNSSFEENKITGGSVWNQNDWSGGAGQVTWTDQSKYFTDDDNISANGIPSGLRLEKIGSDYVSNGSLVSSTFDTGTAVTQYTALSWQPTSQNPATAVKFQIASNNDNSTWNFAGPDGTSNTYYTVSGSAISPVNNGNRYVRYKIFMETSDPAITPVLTSLGVNYVSGCFTPGQAFFPGLSFSEDYSVTVSLPGYQDQTINNLSVSGYQVLEVKLSR